LFIALVLVLVEGCDPFGLSSSSTRLSREAINAVAAPWYDYHCVGCGTGESAPATPQESSLVILIDDRTMKNAQETWPLPARFLFRKLKLLAEEHRPAGVFVDVLLTHERPSPRLSSATRENIRKGPRVCDFYDRNSNVRISKYRLRSFAHLNDVVGHDGISKLQNASHKRSVFWCLKYHYRPVDGPTVPANYDRLGRRFGGETGSRSDPRIPLIMAVPNPAVSEDLMERMISAEAPGDFLARGSGNAPDTQDAHVWRNRLLVPGLRGIATPAVVQSVVNPQEAGMLPLREAVTFDHAAAPDDPVPITTPAAAAVVAFCRNHPKNEFPACRYLHRRWGFDDERHMWKDPGKIDTLVNADECDCDWNWERPLFVEWATLPAETESYLQAGSNVRARAWRRAETSALPADSLPEDTSRMSHVCGFERAALESAETPVGEFFQRLAWSIEILLGDTVSPDRADAPDTVRASCSYTPWLPADLNYWPVRPTGLMQQKSVSLGDLIDGRMVFIGTNFNARQDRTASPVHETIPGVFRYAMAFDNLLRAGPDWRSSADSFVVLDGELGKFELDNLDVLEILLVTGVAVLGLCARERWTPLRCPASEGGCISIRNQTWEPVAAALVMFLLIAGLTWVSAWPLADVIVMGVTLIVYYRDRLLEGIKQVFDFGAHKVTTAWTAPQGRFVVIILFILLFCLLYVAADWAVVILAVTGFLSWIGVVTPWSALRRTLVAAVLRPFAIRSNRRA
jgi:hypothetical protein